MQPIVNGLLDAYNEQVSFVSLNATDGAGGEALFRQLGLRVHPAIFIYSVDGEEVFRQFGIVEETTLIQVLDEIL